ncbi:MAG: hypothetical protein QGG53_37785 [Planctomycetota bacterium]|nr:hypothetical protein [Planctomycetota bacterium]
MVKVAIVLASLFLAGVRIGSAEDRQPVHTLNRRCLIADYGGNKICIMEKDGTVSWQVKAARPQDVWMLANGNVMFTHRLGVKEVKVADKTVVWEFKTEGRNEVHACQPLENGIVMVAESGPMQIVEVDRDMKIVKQVKLQTKVKNPHARMRKARKTKNGTYIVGQYAEAVVREYDGDGKIIREYKQKNAFGASRLPNGNLLLSTGDAHTIKEIDANDKVVWQIKENELPGNPLRFVAGLQRLPNGNTLVCNWGGHGHVGKQPQIFEVTKDKKVVGELFDYKRFKTISGVCVLDVKGDPAKHEIVR